MLEVTEKNVKIDFIAEIIILFDCEIIGNQKWIFARFFYKITKTIISFGVQNAIYISKVDLYLIFL